jgi:hypothetical protein
LPPPVSVPVTRQPRNRSVEVGASPVTPPG